MVFVVLPPASRSYSSSTGDVVAKARSVAYGVRPPHPSPCWGRNGLGEVRAGGRGAYFRPSRRLARLIDFASARCRRSSWRYMPTASGCDSFQTSGRSEW